MASSIAPTPYLKPIPLPKSLNKPFGANILTSKPSTNSKAPMPNSKGMYGPNLSIRYTPGILSKSPLRAQQYG
jgi:hypothetical protein